MAEVQATFALDSAHVLTYDEVKESWYLKLKEIIEENFKDKVRVIFHDDGEHPFLQIRAEIQSDYEKEQEERFDYPDIGYKQSVIIWLAEDISLEEENLVLLRYFYTKEFNEERTSFRINRDFLPRSVSFTIDEFNNFIEQYVNADKISDLVPEAKNTDIIES